MIKKFFAILLICFINVINCADTASADIAGVAAGANSGNADATTTRGRSKPENVEQAHNNKAFEASENWSWARLALVMLVTADVATEAHNTVYEKSEWASKFNMVKAGVVSTLCGGREPGWFDVVLYGGIVTAQAAMNYSNEKGLIKVLRNKVVQSRKEQKELEELRKFKQQHEEKDSIEKSEPKEESKTDKAD